MVNKNRIIILMVFGFGLLLLGCSKPIGTGSGTYDYDKVGTYNERPKINPPGGEKAKWY